MRPPAPRLREELRRRSGYDFDLVDVEAAFDLEIEYYLEHHLEGRDRSSLEVLRDGCADVLRRALGAGAGSHSTVRAAMLAAIRFEPYPEAARTLRELRERGLRLVVASNWDCSLSEVLAGTELAPLVDAVVSSAQVGADKPAAPLFDAALEAAGCGPEHAVHVGDSPENDVAGATASGIRAVLVDRGGSGRLPEGDEVARIRRLDELPGAIDRLE